MMNSFLRSLQLTTPVIQAGMVWVSGGKLAAASANAGALGTIGAGSMKPDLLKSQILKAQSLTKFPNRLAVNVPLLYDKCEEQIQVALDLGIKNFITSAGSPKKFTKKIKDSGAYLMHVVATPELAIKCQEAGVDAVIAEGFEAGGHNGRDEITTMALIPQVVDAVRLPVIAAGGIADGRGIAAVLALGAQAVQMGTRFVATVESSAHPDFKNAILKARATDTMLMMKSLVPVRLLKNSFYEEIKKAEEDCASKETLAQILGHGRAKKGMLEGDLTLGELEIGQIAGLIQNVPTVDELIRQLKVEYSQARKLMEWT
ncbi:MAG: nitronate monooxygenase [Bacteriovoracaceae bacterium]|nr:nitronate monooxygenase [Bacteriovoracaceae bacterium]